MNSFGNRFRITIFGESHGPAIGIVTEGVPAGTQIDFSGIKRDLARRAPGQSEFATPRKEADLPEILSGVKGGYATGAPIACVIRNTDTRPEDYPEALRPGHADWAALLKYRGFDDRSGGGRFSGRLTAGLVFAGALAKQVLAEYGVEVYGRLKAVGDSTDRINLAEIGAADANVVAQLKRISAKPFPAAETVEERFKEIIRAVKAASDSVGGVIETVCFGAPAGMGEPFFESVESRISAMLFSVPAVKGVEFGRGFGIAGLCGSEANDPIVLRNGQFASLTNNSGGVLGGIANGMPLVVRVAVKPTASIGIPQRTVDPSSMTEAWLEVGGRHDPCIAPRAVPVVEAGVAIAVLDLMMAGGYA